MKARTRAVFHIFIFLSIVILNAGAESVSIYDLQKQTDTFFQWDPFSNRGILMKKGKTVSFKPAVPYLVYNLKSKEPIESVKLAGGVPVFSVDAAEKIKTFFAEPARDPNTQIVTTIIIDPGHGGRDSGAIATHTINGKKVTLEEKQIVLAVSLEIADLLKKKYPDKNVLLTRETDVYPSLEDRVELANGIRLETNESIIYISVHANASPFNKAARGFETWYLPPNYRRDLIDPGSLNTNDKDIWTILNTMREEEFTIESVLLAKSITDGMAGSVGELSPNRGIKEESWFVVRNAKMPSVLVELGFITNEKEAALLYNQTYLKSLSVGIYNGITKFITGFEKPGFRAE